MMDIVAIKPGHDGHVAYIRDGHLIFSIEAEKDNSPRYASLRPDMLINLLAKVERHPDVIAISGWVKGFHSSSDPIQGGYFGESEKSIRSETNFLFGKETKFFSSSHERSHLLCAYGLSPFSQGTPCYALVWEGNIGAFYRIDENVQITKIGDVLEDPGNKYAFLYAVADSGFPAEPGRFRFEDAGKLMALASYGQSGEPDKDEAEIIDFILSRRSILMSTPKSTLRNSKFFDIGVESGEFKQLARKMSDAIFNRFHDFARKNMTERLPLIISGGCGLNCDWNTAWVESGLFSDVFIPPCTNDSGSAIGTAVDALRYYSGQAKIRWDAYAGENFCHDQASLDGWQHSRATDAAVASLLAEGKVLAWVQGRYEIGPRALGNRSLLAAPFSQDMQVRLNRIKGREGFRPIAPICLEEDMKENFGTDRPSPHMLYFQNVSTTRLGAVTHVDGSARAQSVSPKQNMRIYELLRAFKAKTGTGVLCNTSLNFKGAGFINRMSDLEKYCRANDIDGFVVEDELYLSKASFPVIASDLRERP